MFDKKAFSDILNKIVTLYDSITDFASVSTVGRSYISKYIHMKIDAPPSPKVLEKIATAAKGVTTYEELMYMCGYTDTKPFGYGFIDHSITVIPLFISIDGKLYQDTDLIISKELIKIGYQYFAYKTQDNSMAPLLNIGDIAIIEKKQTNDFENGKTYLLEFENKIFIRKIVENNQENQIELIAMNPYYPAIKTTKDKITIIGKVIKAENESAFK